MPLKRNTCINGIIHRPHSGQRSFLSGCSKRGKGSSQGNKKVILTADSIHPSLWPGKPSQGHSVGSMKEASMYVRVSLRREKYEQEGVETRVMYSGGRGTAGVKAHCSVP